MITRAFLSRRGLVGAIVAILFICLAVPALFAADSHVVKIGLLAPITGSMSGDGQAIVNGAKLAIQEINKAGGVLGYTFELVPADIMELKPDAVLSAVNKLLADPQMGIILSAYASNTAFEIKNLQDAGMPYITAGSVAESVLKDNPEKNFPIVWSYACSFRGYETELPKVVEGWAKEGKVTLHNKSVALVASDNPYSMNIYKGLKETFGQMGWTVTLEETVPFGEVSDWRVILGKIRSDVPDLIVNTDYQPNNGATFLQQFMENPTNSLVFIQYSPSLPEFLELTKDQSNGVLYDYITAPLPTPRTKKLTAAYSAAFGTEPYGYSYALYEMVYIYANALKQVKDPKKKVDIGRAVGRVDAEVSMGRLKFDPKTHMAMAGAEFIPTIFYQLWDGKHVLLYPKKYADGQFKLPPYMK